MRHKKRRSSTESKAKPGPLSGDRFIVLKVQRALLTTEDETPWLFCDIDRIEEQQVLESKVPKKIVEAMNGDLKMYCEFVYSRKDNRLVFVRRVPTQDW